MSTAQIIYDTIGAITTNGPTLPGTLFSNLKFFVLQRCPSRSTYISQICANGGETVPLEKQAHYIIGDHVRRDSPPGSISYTFIEQSLRDGKLADPADHPAGPAERVVRDVGSIIRPARKGKVPYSAEDDRVLYNWVKECQARGARISGNAIFIQLEDRNQRHTWQSWRDRWLKHLQYKAPAFLANGGGNGQATSSRLTEDQPKSPVHNVQSHDVDDPEPSPIAPITIHQNGHRISPEQKTPTGTEVPNGIHSKAAVERDVSFTNMEFEDLLKGAPTFLRIPYGEFDTAWQSWAKENPAHSWEVWRDFFKDEVLPAYRERTADIHARTQLEEKHNEAVVIPDDSSEEMSSKGSEGDRSSSPDTRENVEITNGAKDEGEKINSLPHTIPESETRAPKGYPEIYITPRRRKRTASPDLLEDEPSPLPEKRQRIGDFSPPRDELQEIEESDPEGRVGIVPNLIQNVPLPSIVESPQDTPDEQASVHPSEELGEVIEARDVSIDLLKTGLEVSHVERLQGLRNGMRSSPELRRQAHANVLRADSSAEPGSSPPVRSEGTMSMERDTQAILNAATQAVDSGMLLPEYKFQSRSPSQPRTGLRSRSSSILRSRSRSRSRSSSVSKKREMQEAEVDVVELSGNQVVQVTMGETETLEISVEQRREQIRETALVPQANYRDTQAILQATTQDIDFSIPEPPGGFTVKIDDDAVIDDDVNDSSPPEDHDEPHETHESRSSTPFQSQDPSPTPNRFRSPEPQTPDKAAPTDTTTIAIAIAEAEPEPDAAATAEADADAEATPTPTPIPTPIAKTTTEDRPPAKPSPLALSADDLDRHINKLVAAGHDEGDVITALKCTCLNLPLTEIVLRTLEALEHVPTKMRGVWTDEDDAVLEGGDALGMRRLEQKHGWRACDLRLRFLEEWRG